MPEVRQLAEKVRSKNAGPFWVTVDVFCGTPDVFDRVRKGLGTEAVAERFDTPVQLLKRFDIESLNVIKISVPRPTVQGTTTDRDMHGAGWAAIVGEMVID
ncbi:MAG: DUF4387 family protein [Pseudomonadota bacterium]